LFTQWIVWKISDISKQEAVLCSLTEVGGKV